MSSGFPDAHLSIWPLTKVFSIHFSKTAIFCDFLRGKVYHNSILVNGFAQKVMGPRSYTDVRKKSYDRYPTRSYTSFQKTKMNLSQLLLLLLLSLYYFKSTPKPRMYPPKNREIALWPNTRVVKYKFCVSQKRIEANHKSLWYNV